MIGIREWDIFKKNFPELAAEYKSFTLDAHHPHALEITMRDGRELYFACGKTPFEYTLTNDEGVKNYLRFGRKFKK